MSKLYVRHRDGLWLNYINSKDELRAFESELIPERKFILADIGTFTPIMKQMLLKLLEENPDIVDCYSSIDVSDPILLSRFTEVVKEPVHIVSGSDSEAWKEAKHDYANAEQMQGDKSIDIRLRLPLVSSVMEKFLLEI